MAARIITAVALLALAACGAPVSKADNATAKALAGDEDVIVSDETVTDGNTAESDNVAVDPE